MATWTQWAPGVDLTGQTVRVLAANNEVVGAGNATRPGPEPHPEADRFPGWQTLPLVPDPDARELADDVRGGHRAALHHLTEHDHSTHTEQCGVAIAVGPDWSIYYLDGSPA